MVDQSPMSRPFCKPLCKTIVVILLISGSIIILTDVSVTRAESTPSPSLQLAVVIYSFNPNTEVVNASFQAILSNYNSSLSNIPVYVYGPYRGEAYITLSRTSEAGTFTGNSVPQIWQTYANPSYYPFDTYALYFNITSQGNLQGLPNGIPVRVLLQTQSNTFLNLTSQWTFSSPSSTTTGQFFTITLSRNFGQGLTEMLPVWVAFGLLGASYFAKPDEIEKRLFIITSLFVFAPVFLLALQPSIPLRFSPSMIENQISILLVGVGLSGIEGIAASRTKVLKYQALADEIGILLIELAFLAFLVVTLSQPLPEEVIFAFVLPLVLFLTPAAVGAFIFNYRRVKIPFPSLPRRSKR